MEVGIPSAVIGGGRCFCDDVFIKKPLTRLFEFIAKGMAWYHSASGSPKRQSAACRQAFLNSARRGNLQPLHPSPAQWSIDGVASEVGAGAPGLTCAGTRARQQPEMKVELPRSTTIYGGLEMIC